MRRILTAKFAILALLAIALSPAQAQEWPARTVTIIVPFSAGAAPVFNNEAAAELLLHVGGEKAREQIRRAAGGERNDNRHRTCRPFPVSYTHLTLPTNREV